MRVIKDYNIEYRYRTKFMLQKYITYAIPTSFETLNSYRQQVPGIPNIYYYLILK